MEGLMNKYINLWSSYVGVPDGRVEGFKNTKICEVIRRT